MTKVKLDDQSFVMSRRLKEIIYVHICENSRHVMITNCTFFGGRFD